MSTLPIHERFFTFQGEGLNMGRAAFFIRTYGCPLHCPWCDAAGTWHHDYKPESITRLTAEQLANEAAETGAPLAVITGGEPAIHDLSELTEALHDRSIEVAIETSGAYALRGDFDFVTVSPKRAKLPIAGALYAATELKLIIDSWAALQEWIDYVHRAMTEAEHIGTDVSWEAIWLHPEWSVRNSPVMQAITEAVKANGDPFRAGYQLHKLFLADALDKRAAVSVPLGGNPALGPSI